jgi:hypothetical protein
MSIRDRLNSCLPRGYFADAQEHTLSGPTTGQSPRVLDVHGDQYGQADACPAGETLAPSETAESWETRAGDSANDGTASPETVQLSAGPSTGKSATGSGDPRVACDSARHMPTPAGENLPEGLDNHPELGVTACGGPSSPQDCPEIAQQLRAARILRL